MRVNCRIPYLEYLIKYIEAGTIAVFNIQHDYRRQYHLEVKQPNIY